MVKCQNISKSFGQTTALNNISFDVNKGELFGIIGPDGSGKTTIFRIMTSLIIPDSGTATTVGFDAVKEYKSIRKRVGYMPGKFSLYADLTVRENLEFFATIFNADIKSNYYLIEDIYEHIKPFENRKAGDLSGGMKQKLALSCALIHKPDVLFLDEPTTGIDVISRLELWQMLQSLKNKNVTVVVSTPYMDEAILCDRIMMLQNGEILGIDTTDDIINQYDKEICEIESDNNYALIKYLRLLNDDFKAHSFGQNIHLSAIELPELMSLKNDLTNHGFKIESIKYITASIEDCFMNLMLENN